VLRLNSDVKWNQPSNLHHERARPISTTAFTPVGRSVASCRWVSVSGHVRSDQFAANSGRAVNAHVQWATNYSECVCACVCACVTLWTRFLQTLADYSDFSLSYLTAYTISAPYGINSHTSTVGHRLQSRLSVRRLLSSTFCQTTVSC
jgi:hypothetical protein